MRTECKVAVLSLAFLLGACSKRQEPTANLPDDLKKDLDAASASTSVLATAPQNYQRMRFVSDIERSRATVLAPRPKISRHPDRMTASHHAATSDPVETMAAMAPAPVSTPSTPDAEQIVVAARPAPEPTSAPVGGPSEGSDNHGGGIGGLLGGIFSGVVIRGGHAGPDKCDPRTDGRARGNDRPDFGMPLPTGQPIFGGGRHR